MKSRLTPLQKDVLAAFFKHQSDFFLTGGAALVGYHLGHRTTEDLDLFTRSTTLEEGDRALRQVARELGAQIESLRTSPDFRRYLLRRDQEAVVVDLVSDPTPHGEDAPQIHGGILVEPPREILANKLCTLLSRAEIRDLVDVLALERAGYDVDSTLPLAMTKDGGLTPAQLAWVLSQIEIGNDALVPGDVTVEELRDYLSSLQSRLTRLAFPSDSD